MPSLWVERAAICPDGPSPASGEGNGGAEPSAASGGCSEAEHRKAEGADTPRLPLERICAQYRFGFFDREKSKFVASTAKRQRGLQRGKPGPPLPCFASFCRSKRKAPAASGANYAFVKGSAPPTGEIKLLPFAGNPSVSLAADSLSLRLGHGAALICHRHIIHYRAATSLPLTQGSLWCRALPLRYPLRGGGCGAVRGAGDERTQSKKIPRPLLDGGKMFFVTWRCSGCRGGYP